MVKIFLAILLWPVVWYVVYFFMFLEQPASLFEWVPSSRMLFLIMWIWVGVVVATCPYWRKND